MSNRSSQLFGESFPEKFLKDYNSQTIWLSVSLKSMVPSLSFFPRWLNLAIGFGSENLYGGFGNRWVDEGGNEYILDETVYPRYRQYYFSPDIDLNRIRLKSPFLKTLLTVLNIFKLPVPGLEITSAGGIKIHWLFW